MEHERHDPPQPETLLSTLQAMIAVTATDRPTMVSQLADVLSTALHADKVDLFMYDKSSDTLIAEGVSTTPMGQLQQQLGLDRLPIQSGGHAVHVYQTGQPFVTNQAERERLVKPGIVQDLGVHSIITVPLTINGVRRGVFQVDYAAPHQITNVHLPFVTTVEHWLEIMIHRAELVDTHQRDALAQTRRRTAEEVVTVLAHDLGNYLAPVIGRLNLMQSRAVRDERAKDQRDASAALAGLRRMQHLMANLLDATRLQHGLFRLERQLVHVPTLAAEVVAVMTTSQWPVTLDIRDSEIYCEADPERLRQVLANLLSNASKHTPAGTAITVTVDCVQDHRDSWAEVRIHDTGPGIPQNLLPHLFNRFVPGSESHGLGMGLYVAQGIIQAHGGTITLASQPRQGTTFTVRVPSIHGPESYAPER
jgi:two-component system, OmpR family, sensor kinase